MNTMNRGLLALALLMAFAPTSLLRGSAGELAAAETDTYRCPACRRFHDELSALRGDLGPALTVTYVNLPLTYHTPTRAGA